MFWSHDNVQEEVELLRRADECTKRVQKPSCKKSFIVFLNINYITISSWKQKMRFLQLTDSSFLCLQALHLKVALEPWEVDLFVSKCYFRRNVSTIKTPEVQVGKARVFLKLSRKKGWKKVGKTPEGLFFFWGLCARSFGLDVIPGTHQRSHLFCPCWDFEASMVMNSGNQPLRWGWGNPLGKVHRQGLQLFSASGWKAWWIRLS